MGYAFPLVRAVVVSLVLIPVLFITILFVWSIPENILGSMEVSRFIREHQAIVTERLSDPRVHSFSLAHDPDHSATLLIQFDVDNKAAYEMLETDLDDAWGLRFPAHWKTNLRSKEDLGNNYGFAAQGMGEVGKALIQVLIAAIGSVSLAVAYLVFALCRLWFHRIHKGRIEGKGSVEKDEL